VKKIEYKWIALSCTTLGVLFSVLTGSTLLIALPSIMKDLNASMGTIIWVMMIYMLIITIFVPSIGRAADMFGKKKLYVSGFVVFTIGSILCGISQTGAQLLFFRVIQGIGGALLVANSSPIVADAFPQNELGNAMGINTMVISVASVIGPILGGVLMGLSWRFIFYINVPIGIAGTIWAGIQLKEVSTPRKKQTFDWGGTLVFTIGMTTLLLGLTLGGFEGWNASAIALLAAALLLLLLFVYIESKVKQPMLDLDLFKKRVLCFAFISVLLNGIARGALSFLLTFYFQGIKAMDPIMSGALLAPFALGMMIVAPFSGKLSDKKGSRGLSTAGLLVSAVGLLGLVRISADSSIVEMCVWMFICGFGSGMFFSPNTSAIMGAVAPDRRGIAAGIRTMMNNAGSVISIAFSMAIISSSIDPKAMQALFAGTQVGSQGIVINQFIFGLRLAFAISCVISIIAAIMSYMRGPKEQDLKPLPYIEPSFAESDKE
jgi:EmrB/QacA subfamily drug resistance transporter